MIQPEAHLQRSGEEHWAGRLYMRRLSPYVTRGFLPPALSANAVTALMLPVGLLAALALTFSGVLPAVGAVVLVQLQLLLDCCDGEVARWRKTFSPKGLYLDQLSHYTTEAALAAAIGVRADGGWGSLGGWTALGLLVAVLILILKAETHLVGLARARSGKPFRAGPGDEPAVGKSRLPLREGVRLLPFLPALPRGRSLASRARRSHRRLPGRRPGRHPCPRRRARDHRRDRRDRAPDRRPRVGSP